MAGPFLFVPGALLDLGSWAFLDRALTDWMPTFSTGDPPELLQAFAAASAAIAANPADVEAHFQRGAICQAKRWYPPP